MIGLLLKDIYTMRQYVKTLLFMLVFFAVISAGVDNKTVLADTSIYNDISSDWKHSNVKVMEHYTDVKSGLDFVVVYMELKNGYVKMTGTKEVAYKYNDQTKKWEAVQVSKLTALSIEPVNAPQPE